MLCAGNKERKSCRSDIITVCDAWRPGFGLEAEGPPQDILHCIVMSAQEESGQWRLLQPWWFLLPWSEFCKWHEVWRLWPLLLLVLIWSSPAIFHHRMTRLAESDAVHRFIFLKNVHWADTWMQRNKAQKGRKWFLCHFWPFQLSSSLCLGCCRSDALLWHLLKAKGSYIRFTVIT